MSLVTEEMKGKAEVVYGAKMCREKVKGLLEDMGLPWGLLPLDNIEESGLIKETGFFWFKRKTKKEHKFKSTGKVTSYAPEVNGYIEKYSIKKLTGVKAKELAIWININEIYADHPTGKITFKALAGLSKSYPVSVFDIEEQEEEKKVKETKGGN